MFSLAEHRGLGEKTTVIIAELKASCFHSSLILTPTVPNILLAHTNKLTNYMKRHSDREDFFIDYTCFSLDSSIPGGLNP